MSTVEHICGACEHPVAAEGNTTVCPHCHAVFHQACWENSLLLCPVCDQVCETPATVAAAVFTLFPTDQFRRARPSITYQITLALVGGMMALLVAVYFSMIGLVIFGFIHHALSFNDLAEATGVGRFSQLNLILYLGGLILGATLLLFFLKPLFNRPSAREEKISLRHADAPQLFALIGRICRSLNAPVPSRVDVNCRVNASVEFRSGWRSLWTNDMILTIGLPLVAGLNISQFAGVIAHEYGHFSQGTAMRTSYLIRKINDWFGQLVHQRDSFDAKLEQASNSGKQSGPVRIILYFTRGVIWLLRRILWLFMAAGNLVSSFMSRQMEFDADRYEIKMCGSENFVKTFLRLQHLNLALSVANKKIVAQWKREKTLFDQIPDFIVTHANEISAESQERHYARMLQQRTRWFGSHPADGDRIARAHAAPEAGLLNDPAPATTLFANYPEISRRATSVYYRELIGPRFKPELLITWQARSPADASDCAIERAELADFFLGLDLTGRPIFPVENKMLSLRPLAVLHTDIAALREEMEKQLPEVKAACADLEAAQTALRSLRHVSLLLEAGYVFEPEQFGLGEENAEQLQLSAQNFQAAAEQKILVFERLGCDRLAALTQWLHLPQVGEEITNAQPLQEEAKGALWMLAQLKPVFPLLLELQEDCHALEVLLQHRRYQPSADNSVAVLDALATQIQERVNAVQEQVGRLRHPYQPNFEALLLGEYARNKEYHAEPLELLLREGKSHSAKLLALHTQLLGRLAAIASRVEELTIVT